LLFTATINAQVWLATINAQVWLATINAQVWLATIAIGFALFQAGSALRIYGKIGGSTATASTPRNHVTDRARDASFMVRATQRSHNMKNNEASWDRIGRVILGVGLIGNGMLGVGGAWGWVMAAVGLVPLTTGLFGFCPIYSIIGRVTKSDESVTI
jgi:hypothetical protein